MNSLTGGMQQAQPREVFDILIIGAGPTGLFGSFYAGIRGMKTRILDSLAELGGQLTTLYPEKPIYDIPGFDGIPAREFAQKLIAQAMSFNPSIRLNEKVLHLEHIEHEGARLIKLTTEPGGVHIGKALLVTSGVGAFTPRKPDLPELSRYEGNGVLYFVREKKQLAGKKVIVVGGGDSAIDWALTAAEVASRVTLVHRRNDFRAQEEGLRKLRESSVVVKTPFEVSSIHGDGRVQALTISDRNANAAERVEADCVIFSLGFISNPGPLKHWGLEMEKNDIKVNSKMESSVHGIYAAGDTSWFPGKLKLIVTGLGEAAIAVNAIKEHIEPGSRFFPGHSSDSMPVRD